MSAGTTRWGNAQSREERSSGGAQEQPPPGLATAHPGTPGARLFPPQPKGRKTAGPSASAASPGGASLPAGPRGAVRCQATRSLWLGLDGRLSVFEANAPRCLPAEPERCPRSGGREATVPECQPGAPEGRSRGRVFRSRGSPNSRPHPAPKPRPSGVRRSTARRIDAFGAPAAEVRALKAGRPRPGISCLSAGSVPACLQVGVGAEVLAEGPPGVQAGGLATAVGLAPLCSPDGAEGRLRGSRSPAWKPGVGLGSAGPQREVALGPACVLTCHCARLENLRVKSEEEAGFACFLGCTTGELSRVPSLFLQIDCVVPLSLARKR